MAPSWPPRSVRIDGGWHSKWTVDEVFCFRGQHKLYWDRAIDEHGQVIDVLLRDKRDRTSAEAFFRQALRTFGRDTQDHYH